MSQENVEIVRRVIESVGDRGQIAEEYYDPEVQYTTMPDGPVHTTYHGIQGVRDGLSSIQESWDSVRIEVREFIEAKDAVVALTHYRVRGRGSGIVLEGDQPWAFWLRNGKIHRVAQYATDAEALKAAGLAE